MSPLSDKDDPGTIGAALREGRSWLAGTGTDTPGLDAEVLLRHVLGIDRTSLFIRLQEFVEPAALAAYRRLLDDCGSGAPVAYLTGEREFLGLTFQVGPGVLVPRPETEILVEWAIHWLRERGRATVVDVGTGSGAIALSIAAAMGPDWHGQVIAAEVSPAAIATADRNRERLGLDRRVSLVQGSLLSWLKSPVELVLANLPYLRPDQIADNPRLAAEPRLALDGGVDGIDLIRRLLGDAPRVIIPGGAVGLEIDPSQRDEVVKLARSTFPGSAVVVLRDLAGFDRHIVVQTVKPEIER